MQNQRYLVTGAAGFVGGRLTLDLLARGAKVDALARPRGWLSAADRLAELAADHEFPGAWPPPNLRVIDGDLEQPDLGLGRRAARRLMTAADQVIHAAARVTFAERDRAALMSANVEALRRFAPLLERSGAVFNHVSTAYACGVLDENGRPSGRFRNPYEESKARAEALVQAEIARRGVAWRILRPSIILGDSQTGRTRNFNTLYTLLQILDGLHQKDGPLHSSTLRIECDPTSALDLVPIDWVSAATLALVADPATRHRVFHLTQPAPVGNAALGTLLSAVFAPLEIVPCDAASFAARPPESRERLVARGLETYRPYLDHHPRFDAASTRAVLDPLGLVCPPVTAAWLKLLVEQARRADWGRRRAQESAPNPRPRGVLADCRHFFDRDLASRAGGPLLEGVRRVDVIFEVRLTDLGDFRRTVEVRDGELVGVSQGTSSSGPDAQCRYELESDDFLRIAAGELDPREAFFARRTEIRGDVEAGLRVATLMIDFFRRHPFRARSLVRPLPVGATAEAA